MEEHPEYVKTKKPLSGRRHKEMSAIGGGHLYYHSTDAFKIAEFLGENWGATAKSIDETVRVTNRFLEEHPEVVKELKVTKSDAPTGAVDNKEIP